MNYPATYRGPVPAPGVPGLSGQLSDVLVNTSVQTGTAIGGTLATSAIVGSGGIAAASTGAAIAATAATAGIAIAGVLVMTWLAKRRQNAMNKVNATQVADEAERILKQNLTAWEDSNKTVEDRELALQNANAIYQWMSGPEGCGNPALGDPGRRCISERLTQGAQYDWYGWYIAPIANYTPTTSAAAQIAQATQNAQNGSGLPPVTVRSSVTDPASGQTIGYVDTVEVPGSGLGADSSRLLFFGALAAVALLMVSGGSR